MVLVHKNCHKDFTSTRSSVEHDDAPIVKKLKSGLSSINWKKECVLLLKESIMFDSYLLSTKANVHSNSY